MTARRVRRFGWREGAAAIALLAIVSTAWVVTRGSTRPNYGGKPSESLRFTLPARESAAAGSPAATGSGDLATALTGPTTTPPVAPSPTELDPAQAPAPASVDGSARTFLDAVVKRDAATAFRLLAKKDRNFFGSPEQFGASLSRAAPWLDAQFTASGSTVVATVQRTPELDDALGLITSDTTITLPTVEEDSVWHIDWRNRVVSAEPTLSDALATGDVMRWAKARQACRPVPGLEHETGLAGVAGFAPALCGAKGAVSVGDVTSLEELEDPGLFIDAFGGDVLRWGRVVTLRAPIDMRVVVAPVGDRWIVIGLDRPESGSAAPAT